MLAQGKVYAIMQLIKNPHKEFEISFKNNIYQFQNKKQKRLQQSSEVTPI
jgi:hypothetical protein